jgi:SAM-dependent methyltransferase
VGHGVAPPIEQERDVDAAGWDGRYRAEELVWSAEPNVFVAEELADLPPGRALDLAAGEGRNALWLAGRGWDVEAVEFSRVALERASALAAQRGVELTLTLADVTDPPRLEPADLVLLAYLHLPRPEAERAVQFAASLVRPGGTFLLVAHARRNLVDGVGGPQDPGVLPDVDDLLDDLADTGLAIRRSEEVTRRVETDAGARDAIDVLIRAERPV